MWCVSNLRIDGSFWAPWCIICPFAQEISRHASDVCVFSLFWRMSFLHATGCSLPWRVFACVRARWEGVMGQVSWGGGGKRLPAVKPQLRNALCLVSASVSLTLLHTLLFRRETTNNSPFCHQSSTHILLILLWNIYRRVHGPLEDYSTSVLHSINSLVQMSDSPIVKYIWVGL